MKRYLAIIVAATLILSGCTLSPGDTNTSEPTIHETENTITTDAPEIETEITTQTNDQQSNATLPMITVSVPVSSEDTTADDGTVIFRVVKQNMHLVMQDPDVADRIIVDFLNRIDHVASTHEETLEQAKNAYQPSEVWTPYLCSITYAPTRIDQTVLSLYGTNVHYTGGAHAVLAPRAANYNIVTGDVLTLGSIITDANAVEKLCALTIENLSAVADEKYLRNGFEETVQQRFSVEESYDEDWYFTTTGLCFYFDQYAIAPYSSGVITAEIPYAELTGIIDDAFFPPELEECVGAVLTKPAEDADMNAFSRISEVIVDTEAPMYVIYCEGTIQNLRITLNDAELASGYTLFASQTLCSSDAIVIQADPNLFHHFEITYDSNGQTYTIPLLAE